MGNGNYKLKEIKPALSGYIRDCQVMLKVYPVPDESVVHDVRVLLKKSRAVLKLTGSQLDVVCFERSLSDLRETGRILSSWRETTVYRKTLKELRKSNPKIFTMLKDNEKITLLLKKSPAPQAPSDEQKTSIDKIESLITRTGYRIRFEPMARLDPNLLLNQLEITYQNVQDLYLQCRNSPKPVKLHEFRKRAKDFLYQLYFFRPLNPRVVKAIERKLDDMTQNLGRYNDLTQLLLELGYKYQPGTNTPAMDELIVRIREKQDRYLSKVWPSAFKVFYPGQQMVNLLGFKLLII